MPTETYFNLPAEKRARILEAAVDEFAEHRFSEASINRIVKAAGIPRGSFYQYFADKEDVYLLVIKEIVKEKMEVFSRQKAPSEDASFFEAAVASAPAILEWVQLRPKYNRIGMLMSQDDSAFVQHILHQMPDSRQSVLALLRRDQQRGLVRLDIELDLVLELVLSAASLLLRLYYKSGPEAALEQYAKLFDLLERGIATKR